MSGGERGGVTAPPSAEDLKRYWGGIFGKRIQHNEDADWLKEEEATPENVPQDEWVDITIGELHDAVKNVVNWKAPGLDQVQNFWIKSFMTLILTNKLYK